MVKDTVAEKPPTLKDVVHPADMPANIVGPEDQGEPVALTLPGGTKATVSAGQAERMKRRRGVKVGK